MVTKKESWNGENVEWNGIGGEDFLLSSMHTARIVVGWIVRKEVENALALS
jgi:hypothetical protein